MYDRFATLFADEFKAHTQKENKEAAKKSAKHIRERFGLLPSALVKRAFDDLKEATPDSWDPKKKETYKADFYVEDVPNQKQWDGTDGSKLEEEKKTCKSGMYSTSQACSEAWEVNVKMVQLVSTTKSRTATAGVDAGKLGTFWAFLSVIIVKCATQSLARTCRSFCYTWFLGLHAWRLRLHLFSVSFSLESGCI